MKPIVLIIAYLALGAAGIAGTGWWMTRSRALAVEKISTSTGFEYPTVIPRAGADPADWKAGHLDGWKWCVQHILEGNVIRDDAALRGLCPPDVNRTAAFLTGYHAARERYDVLIATDGDKAALSVVRRQVRMKPRLNDLNVVALPP